MTTTSPSRVFLGDVQEGGFWDVSFDDAQIRHADAEEGEVSSICVHVDEETGEVSLSDGYEKRSAPHQAENSLFRTFRDAIVDGILRDHRLPDGAPLRAIAEADAARRYEAVARLDVAMADAEDGDE